MRVVNVFQLIVLAAVWGSSFIFMRILAPAIGPVKTADLRILIGGLALVVWFIIKKKDLKWREYWKIYLIVGILNAAVPFILYAFAALYIPASYSSILNAMAPVFGVVFAAFWLKEKITAAKVIGLFAGVAGVALISWKGPVDMTLTAALAMGACLCAAMCYALAGVYMKLKTAGMNSFYIAACSQLLAGVVIFPFNFTESGEVELSWFIVANILFFALVCTSLAFVIYFKLLEEVGPAKALTVTFLIPVFGILWGWMFLNEVITLSVIAGTLLIISGTVFIVKK